MRAEVRHGKTLIGWLLLEGGRLFLQPAPQDPAWRGTAERWRHHAVNMLAREAHDAPLGAPRDETWLRGLAGRAPTVALDGASRPLPPDLPPAVRWDEFLGDGGEE